MFSQSSSSTSVGGPSGLPGVPHSDPGKQLVTQTYAVTSPVTLLNLGKIYSLPEQSPPTPPIISQPASQPASQPSTGASSSTTAAALQQILDQAVKDDKTPYQVARVIVGDGTWKTWDAGLIARLPEALRLPCLLEWSRISDSDELPKDAWPDLLQALPLYKNLKIDKDRETLADTLDKTARLMHRLHATSGNPKEQKKALDELAEHAAKLPRHQAELRFAIFTAIGSNFAIYTKTKRYAYKKLRTECGGNKPKNHRERLWRMDAVSGVFSQYAGRPDNCTAVRLLGWTNLNAGQYCKLGTDLIGILPEVKGLNNKLGVLSDIDHCLSEAIRKGGNGYDQINSLLLMRIRLRDTMPRVTRGFWGGAAVAANDKARDPRNRALRIKDRVEAALPRKWNEFQTQLLTDVLINPGQSPLEQQLVRLAEPYRLALLAYPGMGREEQATIRQLFDRWMPLHQSEIDQAKRQESWPIKPGALKKHVNCLPFDKNAKKNLTKQWTTEIDDYNLSTFTCMPEWKHIDELLREVLPEKLPTSQQENESDRTKEIYAKALGIIAPAITQRFAAKGLEAGKQELIDALSVALEGSVDGDYVRGYISDSIVSRLGWKIDNRFLSRQAVIFAGEMAQRFIGKVDGKPMIDVDKTGGEPISRLSDEAAKRIKEARSEFYREFAQAWANRFRRQESRHVESRIYASLTEATTVLASCVADMVKDPTRAAELAWAREILQRHLYSTSMFHPVPDEASFTQINNALKEKNRLAKDYTEFCLKARRIGRPVHVPPQAAETH
jgi:hypothetical protein